MTPEDKVVEKVKKLLALATSSNEHEAKLAAQRAHELLVKHNLDMQQVANAPDRQYVKTDVSKRVYVAVEEKYISWILEAHFFVRWMQSRPRGGDGYPFMTTVYLIGTKANVQIAQYVHGFLMLKYRELWLNYKRENDLPESMRQSYYLGLTEGIKDTLRKQQNRIQEERGLVLVKDPKLEEIIDAMNLGKASKFSMSVDKDVIAAGAEHGKQIKIQRGLGDSSSVGEIRVLEHKTERKKK